MLTQEEVNQLPAGTEVIITWSGGNGPHKYTTGLHYGRVGVLDSFTKSFRDYIDFVGSERFHTHVELVNND